MDDPSNLLTFSTNNCRGLRNDNTRRDYFNWLKSKPVLIHFLQETHCHLRKEKAKWGREWSSNVKDSF